jgi:uncharacterized DUF497 family protein
MPQRLVLEWTEEAEEHIALHDVTPDEVEEACTPPYALYHRGRVRRRDRYAVLGQTDAGRHLFVVLDALGRNVYRPVTAREMTEAERRLYERRIGR